MLSEMVSIIIPTFNRANLIVEAIDSVFLQTYDHYEVIIVDDGSGDDTEARIAAFSSDKITYIRQENQGAGRARNCGLEQARGEFVAFLDDDDLWLAFKLKLQVEIMRRFPDIAFLCTNFFIKKNDRQISNGLATWFKDPPDFEVIYDKRFTREDIALHNEEYPSQLNVYTGNIYNALLYHPYVLPSTSIVRRSMLDPTIRFAEDLRLYEDWVFFAELAREYDSAYVDIECAVNRGHIDPNRLTLSDCLTKTRCRIKLIDQVWNSDDGFKSTHADQIKEVCTSQYMMALKYAMLEEEKESAREVLKELKARGNFTAHGWFFFWSILVYVPYASQVLRLIRAMKRKLSVQHL